MRLTLNPELMYELFRPKVPTTNANAFVFQQDRLLFLLDNFTDMFAKIDPGSTAFVLDDFVSADYELEDEETGEKFPYNYNEAIFRNNHWDIFMWAEPDIPRFQIDLFLKTAPDEVVQNSVASAAKEAIELAAAGMNVKMRRRERAQAFAELNAQMGRKGLALPTGVLGETFSFLEPIKPHPEPGHTKRRSAAKSLIARERQERLTSNQMEFLESLSPEDRESAYAMLGGRSKKRSKRSKRSKRTRSRSARKGTRSRK